MSPQPAPPEQREQAEPASPPIPVHERLQEIDAQIEAVQAERRAAEQVFADQLEQLHVHRAHVEHELRLEAARAELLAAAEQDEAELARLEPTLTQMTKQRQEIEKALKSIEEQLTHLTAQRASAEVELGKLLLAGGNLTTMQKHQRAIASATSLASQLEQARDQRRRQLEEAQDQERELDRHLDMLHDRSEESRQKAADDPLDEKVAERHEEHVRRQREIRENELRRLMLGRAGELLAWSVGRNSNRW